MIEVKKASELGEQIRENMAKIFVDGYYVWLKFFSKDKAKLIKAFKHIFILEKYYIALIDEVPCAMASCNDGRESSVNLNPKFFRKGLGVIMGSIAAHVLKKEFSKPPFLTGERIASVEFVATLDTQRGKGAASELLKYFDTFDCYDQYVLEVASNNLPAINLYTKHGYSVFASVPCKDSKQSGFDFYLYMKKIKLKD